MFIDCMWISRWELTLYESVSVWYTKLTVQSVSSKKHIWEKESCYARLNLILQLYQSIDSIHVHSKLYSGTYLFIMDIDLLILRENFHMISENIPPHKSFPTFIVKVYSNNFITLTIKSKMKLIFYFSCFT